MTSQAVHAGAPSTTQGKISPGISRNVTLVERHWAWLHDQPRSINATLRQLVEEASRDLNGKYRSQKLKEECYFLMRDMAGDRPLFEEASRALFSDELQMLKELISKWPMEVADKVIAQATEACAGRATISKTKKL